VSYCGLGPYSANSVGIRPARITTKSEDETLWSSVNNSVSRFSCSTDARNYYEEEVVAYWNILSRVAWVT
jgi:hypothetical protein